MDGSDGVRLIFLGVDISTVILVASIFWVNLLFMDFLPLCLFLMHFLRSFLFFLAALDNRNLVSFHFTFLLWDWHFLLGLQTIHFEDGQVADVGGEGDL